MNYEALGRYTAASEIAANKAAEVRNAFAMLGRLTACVNVGSNTVACEYDFAKIRAAVDAAETAHVEMLASISAANHEAIECKKPALTLYKKSTA